MTLGCHDVFMEDGRSEPSDEATRRAAALAAGRTPTSAGRYALLVLGCIAQALAAVFVLFALVETTMNSTSAAGTKAVVFVVLLVAILGFAAGAAVTARSISRRAIV